MARFERASEIRDIVLDDAAADDDSDARRVHCEQQLALLRDGWRRIRDPAREPDYPDEPRDHDLERALLANPDDDQAWLVYADHFLQLGHPRGQLMALETAPFHNIVHRAEREAHAERLRHAASDRLLDASLVRPGIRLKWRRGFIYEARIHGAYWRGDAEDLLFDLLRHPSARFLRELTLTCWHRDAQDHRLLVELLLQSSPPPPLRKLAIEYTTDTWIGFPPLGDSVSAIGTVFPLVEDLRLEGDSAWDLRGLSLPRARSLALRTIGIRRATLDALHAASWPDLAELELWFDDSTCTVDDIAFVFDGTLRNLTTLRLRAAVFANEIVDALLRSPIARGIRELDLCDGALDDRAVARLVNARTQLADELRVRVEGTAVSARGREQLVDADLSAMWW